MTSYLNK